ncbi:MAG: MFS transporter [Anaerolineales bacterium]
MSGKPSPKTIQNVYLSLTLFNTLATSFIWGINTLFLLDAGLTNAQAFLANAFFTVGQVVFEIPTGIVADIRGRRASYMLGALTLAGATLLYLAAWMLHAPFWAWAVSSILLGLGYTFFSGATEAWLVDALKFAKYKGELESVFAKSQSVSGIAMLAGSVGGGFIAQATDLGVPYLLRAAFLIIDFAIALAFMRDWGFNPVKSTHLWKDVKTLFATSVQLGLKRPAVRWIMLGAPFASGVGFYVFYAMQPHLLALYGDPTAYGVAGLAAAIVACAQIVGGLSAPLVRKLFSLRTTALLVGEVISVGFLLLMGVTSSFWLAITFLSVWGLLFAAMMPVRAAYLNSLIPSEQRATVLSFDSLMGSSGGVVIQPILGRVADIGGYAQSFLVSSIIQALAVPLAALARREHLKALKEPDSANDRTTP